MYAKLQSFGLTGLETFPVEVEVDISRGLPSFDIVGLPDASVKESKDRVRSALKNCGFTLPVSKITVNLAPADMKKYGPLYDVPIFLGILLASQQLQFSGTSYAFFGELSLKGSIRSIDGALPIVLKAFQRGVKHIFVPKENQGEVSIIQDISIYPVENMMEIVEHLSGEKKITPVSPKPLALQDPLDLLDFKEVKGQLDAKKALEIGAAGGHNILMIGPPGSGKSMLSKRMPSILPPMTFEETIETTMIHSVSGKLRKESGLISTRPFRAPHHTVSSVGLSGGGSMPKPGEVSLAHNGVLFLDEFPEFSRTSLEILRQPIEDNQITIARANMTVTYPSSIMLIAAMNPCPCGYFGHPTKQCICPPHSIHRYLSKISGPLLDRFDLHIEVGSIDYQEISSQVEGESSGLIRNRVNNARKRQRDRFSGYPIQTNGKITSAMVRKFCFLTEDGEKILKLAFDKMGLSARAYDKILKTALTIADLDGSDQITAGHMTSAISYRSLDKKYWNA